jgi:DNA-binding LytR/AlgR family response regulator
MRVIIVEDEIPAARRLQKLLTELDLGIRIVEKFDSIDSVVRFLRSVPDIDLIFMDIQLADGLCFSVFEQVVVNTPVIFTTAFDQYTLKAFKVNSIDYLLKPIEELELLQAIKKYQLLNPEQGNYENISEKVLHIMRDLAPKKYKERLLIKNADQLNYLNTEDIVFCFAKGKFCFAVDKANNQFLLEQNLTELESELNPDQFYRVNRNLMVNITALSKVYFWFGGRLKLDLVLPTSIDTVVSRDRVNGFKDWLGGK